VHSASHPPPLTHPLPLSLPLSLSLSPLSGFNGRIYDEMFGAVEDRMILSWRDVRHVVVCLCGQDVVGMTGRDGSHTHTHTHTLRQDVTAHDGTEPLSYSVSFLSLLLVLISQLHTSTLSG